jgi:hypothetical protein
MTTAAAVLGYVQAVARPGAAIVVLLRYRKIIESLLPSATVSLRLGGVTPSR